MLGIFKRKPQNKTEEIIQSVVFVVEWLVVGGVMLKVVSFGLDLLGG